MAGIHAGQPRSSCCRSADSVRVFSGDTSSPLPSHHIDRIFIGFWYICSPSGSCGEILRRAISHLNPLLNIYLHGLSDSNCHRCRSRFLIEETGNETRYPEESEGVTPQTTDIIECRRRSFSRVCVARFADCRFLKLPSCTRRPKGIRGSSVTVGVTSMRTRIRRLQEMKNIARRTVAQS